MLRPLAGRQVVQLNHLLTAVDYHRNRSGCRSAKDFAMEFRLFLAGAEKFSSRKSHTEPFSANK